MILYDKFFSMQVCYMYTQNYAGIYIFTLVLKIGGKRRKKGEKGRGGINKGKNYDNIYYLSGEKKIFFPANLYLLGGINTILERG